uniref:Immunoglobulin domain-containing protein n=1 Tax=Cyprinus carpio carpio TaxID=630221 RepID=A0A9J7Y0Q1_CYPCA
MVHTILLFSMCLWHLVGKFSIFTDTFNQSFFLNLHLFLFSYKDALNSHWNFAVRCCLRQSNSSSLFFGVTDELESVSVMEGDSVTLHHNLYVSNIQRDDEIEWRFEGTLIARVIVNNSEYYDEKTFKHRLKLGQTGSLTITNTRSADSGLYQLKTIIGNTESIKKINVIVNARPPSPTTTSSSESTTVAGNDTDVHINSKIVSLILFL